MRMGFALARDPNNALLLRLLGVPKDLCVESAKVCEARSQFKAILHWEAPNLCFDPGDLANVS